jgi:hypothetical protein
MAGMFLARLAQNRPTADSVPPLGAIVTDRKVPQWTEAAVLALPAGEHDEFERKSRASANDTLYPTLGKALSSFANASGGHLILGVREDGTLEGVAAMKGNTPTRQWLEQVIPERCDPPIPDFRVHEVIPTEGASAVPPGTVVLVVDVSGSRANHQSTSDRVFYHRVGGHSVPASSAYLEERRARLTQPHLVGVVVGLRPVLAYPHGDGIFLETKIQIAIRNTGPVAAPGWQLVPESLTMYEDTRGSDYVWRSDFPKRSRDGGIPFGDQTLYPDGLARREEVDLGFRLRPIPLDQNGIRQEIDALIGPDTALVFRVASAVSRGEVVHGRFDPVLLDRDAFALEVLNLIKTR